MSAPTQPRKKIQRITVGTQSVPAYWKESEQGWQAKWTENGEVKRKFSRDFQKLKKSIQQIFATRSHELDWDSLTSDQKSVCQEVIRRDITMDDLARFSKVTAKVTLSQVLDELLEAKMPQGEHASERHIRDLSSRCKKFVSQHKGSTLITSITSRQVETYLSNLKTRQGKLVVTTTRKNHRDSIQVFFNWARQQGYLPRHEPTIMEYVTRISRPEGSKKIWEVDEMRDMLYHCPTEHLPWLALAAFAGIRTAELFPEQRTLNTKPALDWSSLKLNRRKPVIIVPAETSKTNDRRVIPIQPVLSEWLTPFMKRTGPICPPKSPSRSNHGEPTVWETLRERCDLDRRDNALRHSYASYRSAIVGYNLTAEELGNSPTIIKKHYRDIVAEEDAEEWFELNPKTVGRSLANVESN